MRRIRELYRKYPGTVSICAITAMLALMVCVIMFVMRSGVVWGANTDWSNQHFAIPEYFRSRFYATHELFPDFAMQLGAGQNIYNFAYYGLLDPLFLPAYLMPGVPMSTYIQVLGLAVVWVSSVMSCYLFKRHFRGVMPLVLALMFVCGGAVLFHSHRHIMFIEYLPFELGLLLCFGRRDSAANSLIIALMTFCVMCTSFYYSVGAFAAAGVYLIFLHLGRKERSLRDLWRECRIKIAFSALGCICAAVLWLPTLSAIISGREETATDVPLSRLLIPTVDLSIFLYSPYTAGVTSIVLIAALYLLKNGTAQQRFISVIPLCFVTLRVFNYLLNGMMYVDGKAFIPFVPLLLIIAGGFLTLEKWRRADIFTVLAVNAAMLIISLIFITFTKTMFRTLIIEYSFMTVVIIILTLTGRERIMPLFASASAVFVCLTMNNLENFVTRAQLDEYRSGALQQLAVETLDGADGFFRLADSVPDSMNVNRIYRADHLSTNAYSSITNADYRDFRFVESFSENRIRNNAYQTQPMNAVFNALMGCEYRVGDSGQAMLGEELIASEGGYYAFRSDCALPVGYVSAQTMNEADFLALTPVQKPEALLENIIVPENGGTWTSDDTFPFDIDLLPLTESTFITASDGGYEVASDDDFTVTLPLSEPINGDILLLSMTVDNRIGDLSKQQDVIIIVNGVKNKLTDPKWKYNNKNYDFTYVISSGEPMTELCIEFSAGHYTVTDIQAHLLNGSVLTGAMDGKDAFIPDSPRDTGDTLSGTVNVSADGWFTLSFPYDNGFRILVDGAETAYCRTNTAFIGFPVTAGSHRIEVTYEAPLKKTGLAVSAAGIIAAAAFLIFMAIRPKNKQL